jgi:hypothetical protein
MSKEAPVTYIVIDKVTKTKTIVKAISAAAAVKGVFEKFYDIKRATTQDLTAELFGGRPEVLDFTRDPQSQAA